MDAQFAALLLLAIGDWRTPISTQSSQSPNCSKGMVVSEGTQASSDDEKVSSHRITRPHERVAENGQQENSKCPNIVF